MVDLNPKISEIILKGLILQLKDKDFPIILEKFSHSTMYNIQDIENLRKPKG